MHKKLSKHTWLYQLQRRARLCMIFTIVPCVYLWMDSYEMRRNSHPLRTWWRKLQGMSPTLEMPWAWNLFPFSKKIRSCPFGGHLGWNDRRWRDCKLGVSRVSAGSAGVAIMKWSQQRPRTQSRSKICRNYCIKARKILQFSPLFGKNVFRTLSETPSLHFRASYSLPLSLTSCTFVLDCRPSEILRIQNAREKS